MIPTPPYNLASLSDNFSLSYSDVLILIVSLIYSALAMISSFCPNPSIITVSSFVISTFLHYPRTLGSDFSKDKPTSSEITVPPVKIAISARIAFLLSPKAGALTAQTFNPPLNLLRTRVAKASDSTSSEIISKGLFSLAACSKRGKIY